MSGTIKIRIAVARDDCDEWSAGGASWMRYQGEDLLDHWGLHSELGTDVEYFEVIAEIPRANIKTIRGTVEEVDS